MTEEHTQIQAESREEEKKEDDKDDEQTLESEGWAVFRADGVEFQLDLKRRVESERKENSAENDVDNDDADAERYFIGELELPEDTSGWMWMFLS